MNYTTCCKPNAINLLFKIPAVTPCRGFEIDATDTHLLIFGSYLSQLLKFSESVSFPIQPPTAYR